jgi:fumarate hydratase class I
MSKVEFEKLDLSAIESAITKQNGCLKIKPEVLTRLAEVSFKDLSYYLRADHLDEIAEIARSESADANERLVCSALIKNAVVAAEGKLPLCQDTGTATIFAWRGENIKTGADDFEFLEKGVKNAWRNNFLRYSQIAARDMLTESNTGNNLPAQIDISFKPGDEYNFLFMAKGGGSSNKTVLHQGTKATLNQEALYALFKEKISGLGVAACPPYTLAIVIGGTSPENNLKTLKLASAGYYDNLPLKGDGSGKPFRDKYWEQKACEIAAQTGWGAQFGGRHMALHARVIRLTRHAGSCPISFGVSCSAHRNMLAKINEQGVFIEKLDKNPSRLLSKEILKQIDAPVVDLDCPMNKILEQLGRQKAGQMVLLNGTIIVARDMVHAALYEKAKNGEEIPDYFKNHPVYYAGPAQTPEGYAIGSFGPTTAQRMDQYLEFFMKQKASLVSLAKGNRSNSVIKACADYGGFYLGTIGGAAALIAKENILSSEVVDFEEYGMEAVRRIVVKNFPAFIVYDNKGRSLY